MFAGTLLFPMNQVPPEVQAYVQQLVRSQTQSLDSPGAPTEPNPTANILAYWALIMQQQQQQQQQQRSLPMPELATVLTALAQSGADPQQIAQFAPIFAAMVSKPVGLAAGQDADKAGVAGLRAAAQAQGGEAGEGAPAFTELAARVTGGKAEVDASASSSAPMQLDAAALFPLLQLAQPHLALGGHPGGESGGEGAQAGLSQQGGGVGKCAKEKNRAAQRRFRERQKSLISALKENADSYMKQCEEQKRLIETLQKEIQVLKEIIHSKDSK